MDTLFGKSSPLVTFKKMFYMHTSKYMDKNEKKKYLTLRVEQQYDTQNTISFSSYLRTQYKKSHGSFSLHERQQNQTL